MHLINRNPRFIYSLWYTYMYVPGVHFASTFCCVQRSRQSVASWHGDREATALLKFKHVEKLKKKYKKAENVPHWGNLGQIEILSTHSLLSRKFAAVCRKIATSCPPLLLFLPTTPLKTADNRKHSRNSHAILQVQLWGSITLCVR